METTSTESKCVRKSTPQQLNAMVEHMELNPEFARGAPVFGSSRQSLEEQWRKLAEKLNSLGPPMRTAVEWKKDRTFSMGPAVMSRLLDYFDLSGDILQTHIDSPRSTAYLASLFYSVNRINYFYVYGAGSNLKQYRKYIEGLGINNIRLFADSFTSFPIESNRFRTVVGIFANPPNSFSAISDPIDLICSRGGDLGMLEILTDTSISEDGKYRVSLILEEQLRTLSLAMSRPQVQFILYQTHSIVNTENSDMIDCAINKVNEAALQKHYNLYFEKKRMAALEEAEAANIPSAAMNTSSPRKRNTNVAKQPQTTNYIVSEYDSSNSANNRVIEDVDNTDHVVLPDVDKFISVDLPDVCKNQDNCIKSHETGCFLSLMQRKHITRLNAKYLIQMAEKRGLFGKVADSKATKTKLVKAQESHSERQLNNPVSTRDHKKTFQSVELLISRLRSPTTASSIRSNLNKSSVQEFPIVFDSTNRICKRYAKLQMNKIRFGLNHRFIYASDTNKFKELRALYPMKFLNL